MSDYKIKLGVELDTKDIKMELNNLHQQKKINLEFNKKKIDSQLDSIRKQIKNLNNIKVNLGGNTNGGLSLDTGALQKSLDGVTSSINEIKASLGTLDSKSGMKSLLSNINDISSALGKASDESETLVQALNSISKKDLSVNVGINLGGNKKTSIAYGREARKYIIPQLEEQVKYLENLLGGKNAATGKMFAAGIGLDDMDKALGGLNSKTMIEKMESYEKYIKYLKKAASTLNVDLSGFDAQFSKSATQLIDELTEVKQVTDVAEDSVNKFKKMFGSGIDSESLTQILSDLNEIRESLVKLSSDTSLGGLSQNFKELSVMLKEITSNMTTFRQVVNTGTSAGSKLSGTAQEFKEINIAVDDVENSTNELEKALEKISLKKGSINAIIKQFNELGLTVKNIKSLLNDDGSINVSAKGINKDNRIVNTTNRVNGETGEVTQIKVETVDSFKEVENAFAKLKSKALEVSNLKIEIAGLDMSKNAAEIDVLTSKLNRLEFEYDDLYSAANQSLTNNQIKELGDIAQNTTIKVKDLQEQLKGKMVDTSAIDKQSRDYKDLIDVINQLRSIEVRLPKLDVTKNANEFDLLSEKFEQLKLNYEVLCQRLNGKLSTTQFESIQSELDETAFKVSHVESKLKDIQTNRANNIKLRFEQGDFAKDILTVETNFKKLSMSGNEVEKDVNELNNAFKMLQATIKSNNPDYIVQRYKEFEGVLKSVSNRLQNLSKEQKLASDSVKLNDKKITLEGSIDAWLKKYSAAAKEFGGELDELKVKIRKCDASNFNHLEQEFKQIKQRAEAAGVTTQKFSDRLKTQFARYSSYLSVATVFMYIEQGLQDMFRQVVAIDSAMTELKKVTNETNSAYDDFLNNAATKAQEIGTTIDGLVSSTADFARLGYGFQDSQQLAQVANIYTVVGDEIESVEDGTKSLISTMAAYKDEIGNMSNGDFAMDIVDKMNEVSKLIA